MKKILLLSIFVASLFTSCTSDDDNQSENLPAQVQAPEDYTFTRNNESTVKFTGQTTRIFMAEEIIKRFANTRKKILFIKNGVIIIRIFYMVIFQSLSSSSAC